MLGSLPPEAGALREELTSFPGLGQGLSLRSWVRGFTLHNAATTLHQCGVLAASLLEFNVFRGFREPQSSFASPPSACRHQSPDSEAIPQRVSNQVDNNRRAIP